jgi:hypothetical protein
MAEENKTVSIALQQGQRRRIMKGMVYDIEEKHGYIYLVRTTDPFIKWDALLSVLILASIVSINTPKAPKFI